MDMRGFGERARVRRAQLGLNQEEVVAKLKQVAVSTTASHLSRIENGKTGDHIAHDLVQGLAYALDTSMNWLVDGDHPKVVLAFERFRAVPALQDAFTALSAWFQVAEAPDRADFIKNM